jgi:hypothetical protein
LGALEKYNLQKHYSSDSFILPLLISSVVSLTSLSFPEQTVLATVVLAGFFIALLAINYGYLFFVKMMFIWLPLQNFICMVLYRITGSQPLTKGLLVWKEIFLMVGLLYIFYKKRRIKLIYIDYAILLLLAYLVLSAVIPNGVLGTESSLITKVFGLRASMVPFLLYLLGRLSKMTIVDLKQIIRLYIYLAVAVCLFGFIEYSMPHEFWFNIGYLDFKAIEQVGLPQEYDLSDLREIFMLGHLYGHFGGMEIRRMISTFGSPLHVAFYLFVPILFIITGIIHRRQLTITINRINMDRIILFILLSGFIITITRGPLISLIIASIFLVMFAIKGRQRIKFIAVSAILVSLFTGLFMGKIKQIVMTTISLEDVSALGHYMAYEKALKLIPEKPFGLGLGQSGAVGKTFGTGEGVGESLYFTFASEIGIPGLLLFLMIIISIFVYLRKRLKNLNKANNFFLRIMTLTIAAATIAFSIGSLNTEQWRGFTMGGPYWFLLGMTISLIESKRTMNHNGVK